MNRKPVILLLLIVSLPLGLLAWLGARIASDEEAVLHQRFQNLLAGQLSDIDQIAVRHFENLASELRRVSSLPSYDPDVIRESIRDEPLARQIIVLDDEGRLVHPNPSGELNSSEREFLLNARDLLADRDLIRLSEPDRNGYGNTFVSQTASPDQQQKALQNGAASQTGQLPNFINQSYSIQRTSGQIDRPEGWYVWYFGRGAHLIFWQRFSSGEIIATLLERPRWMADLIATLPATVSERGEEETEPIESTRIRLVDSVGRPVYQWGAFEPAKDAEPFAESAVSEPLTTWRLQAFVPDDLVTGARGSVYFNLGSGLGAAIIGITVLGVFFWREYAREVNEAARRVSFVNQVSHELKTPLTNIRMYADLLEQDLAGIDAEDSLKPTGRLRVIISESQRLSRLIGNVLTFSRQQRRTLTLRPAPGCIDDVVRHVVEQFTPALERLNIEVRLNLAASETTNIDVDAFEQILVNLINNVEKYAASGRLLEITTAIEADAATITVSDRGPGVPADQREDVFRPFHRLSDRPVDAAGTGIGLSIARELARLHGGDLQLVASVAGACFQVELGKAPLS